MILYVVTFPENFKPRKIAYKSYEQAVRMCGNFNLKREDISILYFEEDQTRNSFGID